MNVCRLITVSLVLAASMPVAALDLNNARKYELDNGLTVILLEDRNFPVASVQMHYKVGARNEITGKTGLAHFVEHMAFRASENFPDTEVVSRIYAQGGEWHGYTWTDQTTYFATVPKEGLDELLQIEADRMGRLIIDPDLIEAERGAVLAEMHMYDNDPGSMLQDALVFTSFLAHPYRHNTIGWESDIESVTHADVREFYDRHYHPANAVLAVVGDFEMDVVKQRIAALFGVFEQRAASPLPHTKESLQRGERRVNVSGPAPAHRFAIGYRAPRAGSSDYAAFLVMQELLSGGSGVSFLQNDWGTPAKAGSPLAAVEGYVTTWFPPSEEDYMFVISGSVDTELSEAEVESSVEFAIAGVRNTPATEQQLEDAVNAVLDELIFDVQTTEDAAHQLSFFEGIGALDALLTLPAAVRQVSARDVQRVAKHYLVPERRTVGWYRTEVAAATTSETGSGPLAIERHAPTPVDDAPVAPATVYKLRNGLPVVLMESDVSSSVEFQVSAPGIISEHGGFYSGGGVPGMLTWGDVSRPSAFGDMVGRAAADLMAARHSATDSFDLSADPATRMSQEFALLMGASTRAASEVLQPAVIAVVGDVRTDEAISELEAAFGDFEVATPIEFRAKDIESGRQAVSLGVDVAQSWLGYIVNAPGATEEDYFAYRCLLYVLAHGYEGRFGKEAIGNRGLAYYVDADYLVSRNAGWVTLSIGIDTAKLPELETLLQTELARLRSHPPTADEVEEAKRYLVGRDISEALSNGELATKLSHHWILHESLPDTDQLRQRLGSVTRSDVLAAIPHFIDGLVIAVTP